MGRVVAVLFAVAALSAGCGGSSTAHGLTLDSILNRSGPDIGVTAGAGDFAPGSVRFPFLVIASNAKPVERPAADVWVATSQNGKPFQHVRAKLEPIGVPGGDTADANGIYVAQVATPTAGRYWFMAEPVGGTKIQALGNMVVRKKSLAPSVGDRAIPSKTPTLASTGGDLSALTTARHPDRALYQVSVAQALAAHEPFVLAFATPQYCQSRTCGPVVDVVSAVRKKASSKGVRFIHVEIYSDNDPAKGVNKWVSQWRLPTEPFTFVVDRTGAIRTKFEGAFSAAELERAVAAVRRG